MSNPSTAIDGDSGDSGEETPVTELVYSFDWSTTPLGPRSDWPAWLKSTVDLCLHSVFPIGLYIGPERILVYNQMWRPILKRKHPAALGSKASETWSEIYDVLGPLFDEVFTTGKGQFNDDFLLYMNRSGYVEEAYFSFTLSPMFTEDGQVGGIFNAVQETTQRVLMARRLKTLGDLANGTQGAKSIESACHFTTEVFRENNMDIPYAILYLVENEKVGTEFKPKNARLEATTFDRDLTAIKGPDGTEEYLFVHGQSSRDLPEVLPRTPEVIDLTDAETSDNMVEDIREISASEPWPLTLAVFKNDNVTIKLSDNSLAVLCPVITTSAGKSFLTALMICGISKHRALDTEYEEFLHVWLSLVIGQVGSSFTQGRSREEERKQAEMLADLNRQKIAFFQNISHELRSPLTLMLSPLEEAMELCPKNAPIFAHLKLIQKNNRRLLKLVNTLLQFSRIEAGRLQAWFCSVNICRLTLELASNFESTSRSFGLYYKFEIPIDEELSKQLKQKVFLDEEMYEKIVFNLCSNAFKHTWTGGVTVRLYAEPKNDREGVILEVADTGVGIPEEHIGNLFQRFYRIESRQSRSHEGTGIGLALVKELVIKHGGHISVTSKVDVGTTFRIWFPTGWDHLPPSQVHFNTEKSPVNPNYARDKQLYSNAELYLEECMQWIQHSKPTQFDDDNDPMLIDDGSASQQKTDELSVLYTEPDCFESDNVKKCVLVVDDNTDMRNYLKSLIKRQFDCICAVDGCDALRVIKNSQRLPDLILSDIMMPNMNGYELLAAIRNNPRIQMIPVILLSARAGEEASVEGLEKGADDYLIKPFNARELLARIRANIKLSHLRRQLLAEQRRQSETKQLLFTISSKIRSGFGIQETLDTAIAEVKKILSCDSLLIIDSLVIKDKIACKVMSASLRPQDDPTKIVGRIVRHFSCDKYVSKSKRKKATCSASTDVQYDEYEELDLLEDDELHDSRELEVDISSDYESLVIGRRVSIISVAIRLKSSLWGWIVAHQRPGYIWTESEKMFLQQVSNQISLAISHAILVEEKLKREAQMEAAKEANKAKKLRTPLGAIIGALSAFEGTPLRPDQRDMVEVMTRASDVVLSVVNDILDAARLEAQKLTLINRTFDLIELVEKNIAMFGERAGSKEIELIFLYEPRESPKYVKTDPERLQQVIMNLLSNAIKYTEKGKVEVRLSIRERCGIVDGEKIIDTGIGIDPKFAQHIWESYARGEAAMTRRRDGAGLGLSISKSLVDLNGGTLGVDSELNKGSRFWFTWNFEHLSLPTIPKLKTLPGNSHDQQTWQGAEESLTKRVLIIDPFEATRTAFTTMISDSVRCVYEFADYQTAIKAVEEHIKSNSEPMCDFAFFSVGEKNAKLVEDTAKELKRLCGEDRLSIILLVFWSSSGRTIGKKLIENLGKNVAAICKPIMQKRILDCISHFDLYVSRPSDENAAGTEEDNSAMYSRFYNHNRPTAAYNLSNLRDSDEPTVIRGVAGNERERKPEPTNRPAKRSATSEWKDQTDVEERESKSRNRVVNSSKCILCVEDNAVNLKVIKAQLSKLGYQHLSAVNGKEAVEVVRKQYEANLFASSPSSSESKKISLILMDCAMPIMSGFEASQAIRAMGPELQSLPIIALTASAIAGTKEQCLEAGMSDYLTKPLKLQTLEGKLLEWLSEH
ncbi:4726_t:CDS:10 [Paraglomus occultum]|uniref:4726_t:CDS:1 n=1 Tax=Paraglomus occultum TaxID=144539 RepID=A0A9N9FR29_9GLOM|nr:4726_t:CDS:10 [Paraglomus occultum]